MRVRSRALWAAALLLAAPALAAAVPGSWPLARTQPILAKTRTVRLAPDLSSLPPGERAAIDDLVAAGRIMQSLHEDLLHRDAPRARRELAERARREPGSVELRNLLELYAISQGPIATTLDNRREPFLAVDSVVPGKAFYPWGVSKEELETFLAAHPESRAEILDVRTVVRRTDQASLRRDLTTLDRHPELDVLHPGLRERLVGLVRGSGSGGFYAVPFAVDHADSIFAIYRYLNRAAVKIAPTDRDFAGYLRARSRDLLANDYEAGDASWVKGRFRRLNAQIGAYESYDDELYGAKPSYGFSLMLTDQPRTRAVREAIRGLQDFENALPYAAHKKVIEDIPVGVYDVIADFGQARGTNTASILPNESEHARRYGRTILMRRNILIDPAIVAAARRLFEAAIVPSQVADWGPDGSFNRTLWHELGHYLGPDRDQRSREPEEALEDLAATFEEMKADLVSLFSARELRARGYYDDQSLRHVYAAGVLRTLNKNRPRPDQPYNTMQLMQFNWYLDQGSLTCDPRSRKLTIHYDRYHEAVASLIEKVLDLQYQGDRAAAAAFVERWTTWDGRHVAIATALKAAETNRFWRVKFAVLGE